MGKRILVEPLMFIADNKSIFWNMKLILLNLIPYIIFVSQFHQIFKMLRVTAFCEIITEILLNFRTVCCMPLTAFCQIKHPITHRKIFTK